MLVFIYLKTRQLKFKFDLFIFQSTAIKANQIVIMIFEEYLNQKKINHETFLWAEPERFNEFKKIFNQVHPDSFTSQKKFLINDLRRKYKMPIY